MLAGAVARCARALLVLHAPLVLSLLGCSRVSRAEKPTPARSAVLPVPPPAAASAGAPSASSSAAATTLPPEPSLENDARCKEFEAVPLPPADQPTPEERRALAHCDAEPLYYGFGSPPDFVQARKCAYTQRGGRSEPVFGGAGMLMMIYANGRGVPVSFELALRFACESGGSLVELESAVTTLLEARQAGGLKDALDLCDFTTSGFRAGFCAGRDERFSAVARNARKAKATAALPTREVAALEHAARVFFEARARNEVDQSGTLRAALSIEEEARLQDEYVDMLEKLGDPSFAPTVSSTQAALDASFRTLLRCKDLDGPFAEHMGFSRQGLKATEQRWASYRDAWVALVAKTRPSNVSAWNGWLIDQRRQMLGTIPLCP